MPTAKVGMRVHVFSPHKKKDWGYGTIEEVSKMAISANWSSDNYPSIIRLDSGKVTEGCKCWWYPIEEEQ